MLKELIRKGLYQSNRRVILKHLKKLDEITLKVKKGTCEPPTYLFSKQTLNEFCILFHYLLFFRV